MLHFPSTLTNAGPNGIPGRSDGLNATQQKAPSHQIFLTIEEELHDARRVHSHGQEEDLRLALNMVISRVSDLSTLLSEAYKSHADLEVQLNVAKSNLQLVISNNEMLEEALKRDSSGHSKDVGWRRWGAREGEHREQRTSEERPRGVDYTLQHDGLGGGTTGAHASAGPSSSASSPGALPVSFVSQNLPSVQDNRFFKFRFTSGSGAPPRGKPPTSRPGTPSGSSPSNPAPPNGAQNHLTSSSMPSLPSHPNKEIDELSSELEREREARKVVCREKAALEAEVETLTQALFEEANKMVKTERIKRAETEAELRESHQEKEALRSALRLIEGENMHLRGASTGAQTVEGGGSASVPSSSPSYSRTSSRVGVKSPPASTSHSRTTSLTSAQVSASSPIEPSISTVPPLNAPLQPPDLDEDQSEPTPRHVPSPRTSPVAEELDVSPWADVPSTSPLPSQPKPRHPDSSFSAATLLSMR